MTLVEPIQICQIITQEFERRNIRYLVGGSLASSLHGSPRATHDVDLVAEITYENIPELMKALESDFYLDPEMIRQAIQYRSSFNVIHRASMFKLDIFILKPDMASQEEMIGREWYQVSENPNQTLVLASAEDIIVHILYRYKLSGGKSERQWRDVLGVIQVQQKKLDRPYLERAAHQRGVSDLLDQALQAAKLKD